MSDQSSAGLDSVILKLILGEVQAGRIHLYRNLVGQPWVHCNVDQEPVGRLNLRDKDFRGWLTLYAWHRTETLLRERQVDRILEVLSGLSMHEKTLDLTDPELLRIIEVEPLVAVVVEFMEAGRQ